MSPRFCAHPTDIAFGLCDLGLGYPELGTVRITELEAVRCILGFPVARDRHWRAVKSLEDYVADALKAGHVVA